MRKLIVLNFITLDGVLQSPGARKDDTSGGFTLGGWRDPYLDESLGKVLDEQWRTSFDLLLGRKTFEIFASYWPDHTEQGPGPGFNRATKYVASNTLTSHTWQKTVFLNGDVAEKVRKLKQEDGPDLHVYGSSNLIQTLLKHDLIDEFWLKIVPLTLGTGKRLFGDGTIPKAFQVTQSLISPTGVMVVNLTRAGEVQTATVEE